MNNSANEITDAKSAARFILSTLPLIGSGDYADIAAWESGKVALLASSVDRAFIRGTLTGIAEGHIASGDNRLCLGLNAIAVHLDTLCKKEITENGGTTFKVPNTDITCREWNILALEKLSKGIFQAARFGLMTDNLALHRERALGFAGKL